MNTHLIKKSWNKVWPPENITEDLSEDDGEDNIPLVRLAKKMAEIETVPETEDGLQVICSLSKMKLKNGQ